MVHRLKGKVSYETFEKLYNGGIFFQGVQGLKEAQLKMEGGEHL